MTLVQVIAVVLLLAILLLALRHWAIAQTRKLDLLIRAAMLEDMHDRYCPQHRPVDTRNGIQILACDLDFEANWPTSTSRPLRGTTDKEDHR